MKLLDCRSVLFGFSALISGMAWSQNVENAGETEQFTPEVIYEPRYPNLTCPPEYSGSRALMEEFLSRKSSQNFRQQYGVPLPDSISDVQLLEDKKDFEACRYFHKLYEDKINLQYKLCKEGMAWYLWDFTYYKSDDYFFVVRSGGNLGGNDRGSPGCARSLDSTSRVPPVTIFLREDFFQVPFWN